MMPKLFLGPMSKNIIDVIIRLNNEGYNIGMIPSRRQIDYFGGYVNNWKTYEFSRYIRNQNPNIVLCRDHAGPIQGRIYDDGLKSLEHDSDCFNIIHIDPWKFNTEFLDYLKRTVSLMKFCYDLNPRMLFEIGTEEGIKKIVTEHIYHLIQYVKDHIDFFDNVKYVVVQSGTNLKMDKNIGIYDEQKLKDMISIANEFGLMTKEHNGDYLEKSVLQSKFKLGLDSINIAPEIGKLESECYLESMSSDQFEKFFTICYESKTWIKWLKGDQEFNPFENKEKIIKVCGHYVFSNIKFLSLIKDIDIKEKLYDKIKLKVIGILGE